MNSFLFGGGLYSLQEHCTLIRNSSGKVQNPQSPYSLSTYGDAVLHCMARCYQTPADNWNYIYKIP